MKKTRFDYQQKKEIMSLHEQGRSMVEIAKRLKCHHNTIRYQLIVWGLHVPVPRVFLPKAPPEKIVELRNQLYTYKEIAEMLQCSIWHVQQVSVAAGLGHVERKRRQRESRHASKIAEGISDGLTLRQIAAKIGISGQRVDQIRQKNDLPPTEWTINHRGPLQDDLLRLVIAMAKDGMGGYRIGRALNISHYRVRKALLKHGIQTDTCRARINRRISELYDLGLKKCEISRATGVHLNSINDILQRQKTPKTKGKDKP